MLNIGVGSIITKGLGGPACNLMIFGPFRLYIEPFTVPVTPSPTVPIPTPTPSSGGGGGGGTSYPAPSYIPDDDDDVQKYKLTFVVKFRSRIIERTFIVDSFKKDKIIKRVGQINTLTLKFKIIWDTVKNNRFITRWKK